LPPAPVQVKE
jgi:hypothetical protein